ncbi:unnamed protein product, partial [Vitis vinifera]|uniref:Uncharacterized protein n=1 Tax=Vitis vinifera TaxID=29760 RepID=D7U4S3_VITVI
MISPKKLIKMARKWQRDSSLGRERISSPRTNDDMGANSCSTSVDHKGHFVVYIADRKRFMLCVPSCISIIASSESSSRCLRRVWIAK